MNFRKTSLTIFIVYVTCISALFLGTVSFNIITKNNSDVVWQVYVQRIAYLLLLWVLAIAPQFILLQYVTNFQVRWAQLFSLILQIIAFIGSLYVLGKILILMHTPEVQPVELLLYLPIWECVIFLALGLIFKLIKSY